MWGVVGRSFLWFFVDNLKGVRCLERLFNKIAVSSQKHSCWVLLHWFSYIVKVTLLSLYHASLLTLLLFLRFSGCQQLIAILVWVISLTVNHESHIIWGAQLKYLSQEHICLWFPVYRQVASYALLFKLNGLNPQLELFFLVERTGSCWFRQVVKVKWDES